MVILDGRSEIDPRSIAVCFLFISIYTYGVLQLEKREINRPHRMQSTDVALAYCYRQIIAKASSIRWSHP